MKITDPPPSSTVNAKMLNVATDDARNSKSPLIVQQQ